MTPRLKLTAIRKAFGATQALRGVTLEAAPGEVHALDRQKWRREKHADEDSPERGARADSGEVVSMESHSPRAIHWRRSGVAMIYQSHSPRT
jgi:hypothetical protein